MKTVLAFDTATEALSVALQHGEQQYTHFEVAPRLHAQKILPLIDDML
ncbi:MAG TPA: tRNA (adenosine(37)-N6)-threonylcarbamoyltransferase complex dimerization subunit type 1 TsaB, partial [Permianibacter sp.]|nr:tRNA (adenosine(37)-N6)-threonylcarbamoyltransferase complex dimerization subunit type 1 TsaB [Permianibacter sp.]